MERMFKKDVIPACESLLPSLIYSIALTLISDLYKYPITTSYDEHLTVYQTIHH